MDVGFHLFSVRSGPPAPAPAARGKSIFLSFLGFLRKGFYAAAP
jgi:hypothetical protein